MPTWCHMFNSTLTGNARVWFDDLPQESIDSYDDLKKAFLDNYLQQKKRIKDPVKIHNIKQRDGESTEEFVRRYKLECRDVKGAPECMKISGFMHGITNPKAVTFNQGTKTKQWERSCKSGKKRGNLRKGQTAGNLDGTAMAEGSQIKDYPNLLSGFSDLLPALRGGGWDGGFRQEVKSQMVPTTTPLVGFSGEIIWLLRRISLLVKIGDEEHSTSAWMNFMVVRSPSPYNGIIGRPGVRRIQAVPSTAHGMLKFPVTGGTVTLQSSMIIPLECTMVLGPGTQQPVINQVD
ncbi:reverse transcriptase domain-containing protein [Tanacetum coccineum]